MFYCYMVKLFQYLINGIVKSQDNGGCQIDNEVIKE